MHNLAKLLTTYSKATTAKEFVYSNKKVHNNVKFPVRSKVPRSRSSECMHCVTTRVNEVINKLINKQLKNLDRKKERK